MNDSTSPDTVEGREVSLETMGPMGLLVMALAEAEDGLDVLPLTGEAQRLRWRLGALKTVTNGLVRGIPRLTDLQRARLVMDAQSLAIDVNAERERLSLGFGQTWA